METTARKEIFVLSDGAGVGPNAPITEFESIGDLSARIVARANQMRVWNDNSPRKPSEGKASENSPPKGDGERVKGA